MAKYDVFVSYRRSSFESASLIAEKLSSRGYSVFFDLESLRAGKFNEQLFDVIDNCKDFVLVLPPGALDRCVNEDDWVRLELLRAMQGGKNIIPVMLNGFTWPDPMPAGLEEVSRYQAISAGEVEYFDMSMNRLSTYLKSSSNKKTLKAIKIAGICVAAVLACLVIAQLVIATMSKPVYRDTADNITKGMSVLNSLHSNSISVNDMWKRYLENREKFPKAAIAELESGIKKGIVEYFNSTNQLYTELKKLPSLTSWQRFQLGVRDITQAEIDGFYGIYDTQFQSLLNRLDNMYAIVESGEYQEYQLYYLQNSLDIDSHAMNMLYYSYMEMMSKYPAYALELYHLEKSLWNNYPAEVSLDLDIDEYRRLQDGEYAMMDKLVTELEKQKYLMQGEVNATAEQFQ